MLTYSSGKNACFEHSDFLKVNYRNPNRTLSEKHARSSEVQNLAPRTISKQPKEEKERCYPPSPPKKLRPNMQELI